MPTKQSEFDKKKLVKQLIHILKSFVQEINSAAPLESLTSTTSFEKELGVDSLGKVEIFSRFEKALLIKFPTSIVANADTIDDIVTAFANKQLASPHYQQSFISNLQEATVDPSKAETLLDVLKLYNSTQQNRPHIYLQDEHGTESIISYGKLYSQAQRAAAGLIALGVKPHDTVAIMLPTCEEFFFIFMGTLLAGAIPVPIYPPYRPDAISEYALREAKILQNAEVRVLITFQQAEALSKLLKVFIPSLKAVATAQDLFQYEPKSRAVKVTSNMAALIQYTSGSTSAPKGVLLHHANLLANIRSYGVAFQVNPQDVIVSWLPLYHDMGLIGSWLGSFYYGIPVTIMSPLVFLTHPERWLWAIHYHRASLSGAPNFAYELCINKIDPKDLAGLDLSCWRIAFNGAEAVNPDTLSRFIAKFAPFGFKPHAMSPTYGLAENCVCLTFSDPNQPPTIDHIDREAFEKESIAKPTTDLNNNKNLSFAACGSAIVNHEVRIIDESSQVLPERHIGHIQFKGPSAMQGYYRNNEATAAIYHEGWFNTGDLGYLADNQLYIVGRKKDVIIKAGRNFHPEEIELAAAQVNGIRKGCVVVFGVNDQHRGTENIVIIAESKETSNKVHRKITADIIEKVATVIGIPPDDIVLVKPKTIPKTSSGKLQRSACKKEYLAGKLRKKRRPFWMQILTLYTTSFCKKCKAFMQFCGKLIYNFYLLLLILILLLPCYITLLVTPKNIGLKFSKFVARWLLRLAFCPLTISGEFPNTEKQNYLYLANHTSYLDVVVLLAVLPSKTKYVAKSEIFSWPIVGVFMHKFRHIAVKRQDFEKAVSVTDIIINHLKQKESILLFPEGTFTYTSGLRPFKFGAFKAAVYSNTAICPITLRGVRQALREGNFLISPKRIFVHISDVMQPQNKNWDEVVRLRDLTRQEIAKYCGEEILNI